MPWSHTIIWQLSYWNPYCSLQSKKSFSLLSSTNFDIIFRCSIFIKFPFRHPYKLVTIDSWSTWLVSKEYQWTENHTRVFHHFFLSLMQLKQYKWLRRDTANLICILQLYCDLRKTSRKSFFQVQVFRSLVHHWSISLTVKSMSVYLQWLKNHFMIGPVLLEFILLLTVL